MLRTYHTYNKVRSQSDVFLLLFLTPKYYRWNKNSLWNPFSNSHNILCYATAIPTRELGVAVVLLPASVECARDKTLQKLSVSRRCLHIWGIHSFNIISLSCDKGSTQYQFWNYGIISILYYFLPARLPLQGTSPFLRGMAPTLSWASLFSTKRFLDNQCSLLQLVSGLATNSSCVRGMLFFLSTVKSRPKINALRSFSLSIKSLSSNRKASCNTRATGRG